MMRRNPEHVFQFMMAELGTEGSIDGNQRLVIRGKFVPKVKEILCFYLSCCSQLMIILFTSSCSISRVFSVNTSLSTSRAKCAEALTRRLRRITSPVCTSSTAR
jgi:hypothetical protein